MRWPDISGLLRRADRIRLAWTDALVGTRAGLRKVALFGFLESTFVPMPLEAVTVPLMLQRPDRAHRVALALWLGAILGAAAFYLLGRALFNPVVAPILGAMDMRRDFDALAETLSGHNLFWTVFLISIAPAPLQLATLGAGFVKGDPTIFMAAIALSRGLRYFGVAWLCRRFGLRFAALGRGTATQFIAIAAALAAIWLVYRLLT